jgi:hypothetical protein
VHVHPLDVSQMLKDVFRPFMKKKFKIKKTGTRTRARTIWSQVFSGLRIFPV